MSESTHRLVQGLVEASFAGEHTIKGKAEPQKVFRLHSPTQSESCKSIDGRHLTAVSAISVLTTPLRLGIDLHKLDLQCNTLNDR